MSYFLSAVTLLALSLGLVLPIATLWLLINVCALVALVLTAVLIVLVASRQGRWAFAWRGQRAFVAVGVTL